MPVTTLNITPAMSAALSRLQAHYGASSNAEIFRKAIAFLDVAKESEQSDGSVVIKKDNGDEIKVVMK